MFEIPNREGLELRANWRHVESQKSNNEIKGAIWLEGSIFDQIESKGSVQ